MDIIRAAFATAQSRASQSTGVYGVRIRISFVLRHLPFAILYSVLAGCGPTSFVITPVPASRELQEHVVARESAWARQKIAMIEVEGTITNARTAALLGTGADNPVVVFKEKLDRAAADSAVRAIVLRINSPGGGVTASDLMY